MESKVRNISGSLVITIQKQICDFYNFKNGDILFIEPIEIGDLRIRKK